MTVQSDLTKRIQEYYETHRKPSLKQRIHKTIKKWTQSMFEAVTDAINKDTNGV